MKAKETEAIGTAILYGIVTAIEEVFIDELKRSGDIRSRLFVSADQIRYRINQVLSEINEDK